MKCYFCIVLYLHGLNGHFGKESYLAGDNDITFLGQVTNIFGFFFTSARPITTLQTKLIRSNFYNGRPTYTDITLQITMKSPPLNQSHNKSLRFYIKLYKVYDKQT